jgi:hypothetical protein
MFQAFLESLTLYSRVAERLFSFMAAFGIGTQAARLLGSPSPSSISGCQN